MATCQQQWTASGSLFAASESINPAVKGSKPSASDAPPPLPRIVIAALASGSFGVSILVNVLVSLLVYFYLPPDDAEIPELVTDSTFLGVLNAVALIAAAGRIVDAVTDVIIAAKSDRCTNKRGRRIPFMAVGALPAALCTIFMFVPPVNQKSGWNIVYLLFLQVVLFTFLTLYLTPLHALVADLGSTPEERLKVTMWVSFAWAIGLVIAACTFFLGPVIYNSTGASPIRGWQGAVAIVCIIGFIAMVAPVAVIDEKKYTRSKPCAVPLFDAVKTCLSNRFFRVVIAADFVSFFATTLLQTGLPYYITVLVDLDEFVATICIVLLVLLSMGLYPAVAALARSGGGGKRLLRIAFAISIVVFLMVAFAGVVSGSDAWRYAQVVLPIVAWAFPYSILNSIFFWLTTDAANHASMKDGHDMAAMFFASRLFFQKMAGTAGVLVFALLLQLGRDEGDDLGVRLTAALGAILYIGNVLLIGLFDENTMREEMNQMKTATAVEEAYVPADPPHDHQY